MTFALLRNHGIPCFAPEGEGASASAASAPSESAAPSSSSSAPSAESAPTVSQPSGASPSPTPPSPEPLSDDVFDFEATIFGPEDGDADAPPNPPETLEPPPSVQPPPAEPATPPANAAPEVVVPPSSVPDQGGPQSPPSLDLSDPSSMARLLREGGPQLYEAVAKQRFTLSPEDIEGLETDMVGTLPRLAAKIYAEAVASALEVVHRTVPQMIQKDRTVSERNSKSEDQFYSHWKAHGIDKAKHGKSVQSLAAWYRGQNPNATLQQMIEAVGPLVIAMEKIQAPSVVAQPNGFRPPPSPFRPAIGSPPAAVPQPPAQNDFEILGADIEG